MDPRQHPQHSHKAATNLASNAVRSAIRSIRMLSFTACAPSPTVPNPSSVGTPSAAEKFPSEPPPVADSSNTTPSSTANKRAFANNSQIARVHIEKEAYRRGHVLGNLMFTRVFSRALVQSFPTASRGFEIETELTVHALTLNLPAQEIDTPYKSRPEGSVGKLHTRTAMAGKSR